MLKVLFEVFSLSLLRLSQGPVQMYQCNQTTDGGTVHVSMTLIYY